MLRIFGLLVLVGCAPSIDAAAKAAVDKRIAELQPSGQAYPPPGSPEPMPLAVGQWTTYKFVDKGGQPSLMTFKLVGQSGSDWWYESVIESYTGKTNTRMLVDFGDRRRLETIVIKEAKLRDPKGNAVDYPPGMIGLVNSLLRGQLGPLGMDWTGSPQESVTTPAGQFTGCYNGRSEIRVAGVKSTAAVWGHTAVPLSGMVKSRGDDGTTGELVAFGTSGATSDF